MRHTRNRKARYMPGLDGLRALSVLAVIAYHLNWQGTPGGYLGVGIFFVLSGYLITDQLVAEWQRGRKLDLAGFWLRRARRLLPAMLLMLAAVCLYLGATDAERLRSLGGDLLSSVTYVNNWWLIYHNVSYFESFGPPSPLGHFWSLAVEEQFYVVWPLVLAVCLRLFPRRGWLFAAIAAGAVASAAAMWLLYTPGADPSRVYYGSDTRAFALLLGAALAVVWPSAKLREAVSPGARRMLDGVGLAALAAILYMIAEWKEYDPFVYRGGLALLSVASAALVACLAHPASRLGKLFAAKPLRWLGARSYGIYLWHFPVIALTTSAYGAESFDPGRAALQTAASLVLAALSWKLVERPILRGTWRNALTSLRAWHVEKTRARKQLAAVATACFAFVLCVSCVGTGSALQASPGATSGASAKPIVSTGDPAGAANAGKDGIPGSGEVGKSPSGGAGIVHANRPGNGATSPTEGASAAGSGTSGADSGPAGSGTADPAKDGTEPNGPGKVVADGGSADGAGAGSNGGAATGGDAGSNANANANANAPGSSKPSQTSGGSGGAGAAGDGGTSKGTGSATASPTGSVGSAPDAAAPRSGKGVTVIGDSVILGVKPYLEKLLPGIVVDGKVGRQLIQGQDVVEAHAKAGDLGDLVILELGTNGPFAEKKLTELLDAIGEDRDVMLINTRVPRKWQDDVNDMLQAIADENDRVTLIDWYSASEDKESFFAKDGVHLNRKGGEYYAAMVAKALDARKLV